MSTLKVNNLQVGQDSTATNNFALYQPTVPDGTVRLAVGNVGSLTDRLTITSGGNLGIGTTNPSNKLEVYGDITLGTNYNHRLSSQNSNAYNIGFTSTSALIWGLQTSGGISTTLTITAWNDGNAYFDNRNNGDIYFRSGLSGTLNNLLVIKPGAVLIGTATSTGTASQLLQVTGGGYFSGNLGIGVTNPGANLDIGGTSTPTLRLIENTNLGTPSIQLLDYTNASAPTEGLEIWYQSSTGNSYINSIYSAGSLIFSTASGGLKNTSTERVRITSSGNVGIGTTNPSEKLTVYSTTTRSGNFISAPASSPVDYDVSEFFKFSRTSGISGVTFSAGDSRLLSATITPTNEIAWRAYDLGLIATDYLFFSPGGGEKVRITSAGFVGVGITNPTAGLTIATAGSTTTGASQIYLHGGTSNRIDFNTNGVAAPSLNTRSAGTKIVLYPEGVTSSATDYAIGIENGTLWNSVPLNTSARLFKWYGGTTNIMTLRGDGVLTTPYQPAFKVAWDSKNATGADRVLSTNAGDVAFTGRDCHNVGNYFDSATGKFTAPVAGTYVFIFSLMRNVTNGTVVDVRFQKNSTTPLAQTTYSRAYAGGYSTSYQQMIMVSTIPLAANDYVLVGIGANTSIYNDDTYFAGYLLG